MKNMPTTGACLAAKEIADYQTEEEDWTVLDLAEIIDRHSAVPDLLTALRGLLNGCAGPGSLSRDQAEKAARAAIAKATK